MRWLHPWPDREPSPDKSLVGISFVDVLFALVIGEVLAPLKDFEAIPWPGRAHLVLAALLTLTSWVGYHTSVNRPTYMIRFPNLPLLQFTLDICMVVAYWLAAITAERLGQHPSALAEASAVAGSFALYVAWDWVAYRIRKHDRYERRPIQRDVRPRRAVTIACALVAATIWLVVVVTNPSSESVVYAIDAVLVVLIVGFRLLKEYVTVDDPFRTMDATAPPAAA